MAFTVELEAKFVKFKQVVTTIESFELMVIAIITRLGFLKEFNLSIVAIITFLVITIDFKSNRFHFKLESLVLMVCSLPLKLRKESFNLS